MENLYQYSSSEEVVAVAEEDKKIGKDWKKEKCRCKIASGVLWVELKSLDMLIGIPCSLLAESNLTA